MVYKGERVDETGEDRLVTIDIALCEVEAALREAEEQAAYWSRERARLYEKRERLLERCVARVPARVFQSAWGGGG